MIARRLVAKLSVCPAATGVRLRALHQRRTAITGAADDGAGERPRPRLANGADYQYRLAIVALARHFAYPSITPPLYSECRPRSMLTRAGPSRSRPQPRVPPAPPGT